MLATALPNNPASMPVLKVGEGLPPLDAAPRDALPSTLDRQSESNGYPRVPTEVNAQVQSIALALFGGFILFAFFGD